MNELLKKVTDAHGGLTRWTDRQKLSATIITGGAFWAMKGLTQDADARELTVWLHEERSTLSNFGNPEWHLNFKRGYVSVEQKDGAIIGERANPRASFLGHGEETPWDPLHLAYFDGYALWTYLTTPFSLTMVGVSVSEIEPWTESTETWRGLRAHFPGSIETHSAVQDFYFGSDFLLRRHDYAVDVAGGFHAAHMVYDYADVDGIKIPTRRRAYRRGVDLRPIQDPIMVSIDVGGLSFS